MALFKICRGAEANLPATKTDGYAYFCTDTQSFYIDWVNDSNTLVRSKLAVEYADKLRYEFDGETIEIDPATILTDDNYATKIGSASTSKAGLMSSADKKKLDGIATGANAYTHPTTSGNKHIPSGGSSGQILRWSADGTAVWGADSNTTYSVATTSANGLMSSSDKSKLDGIAEGANNYTHPSYTARTGKPTANAAPAFGGTFTVSQITSNATGHVTGATDRTVTIPNTAATTSAAGLMSASDKTKLDGIATGANNYSLPTASSSTLGGVKTTSTVTSTSGLTACPIISGVPYYKDTNTTYGTATTSANGLMSSTDKSKLDGIAEGAAARNVWYGTCATAGSTSAKVVATHTGDFTLTTGATVYIAFTNGHTATSMTLNIDGTGAVTARRSASASMSSYWISANELVCFVYNGGSFVILDGGIASTSYYGVTKLSSSTSSTSTALAATPSAVKSAYDLANAALPKAGGTMTGALTLAADPTADLEAATKQYVDGKVLGENVWVGVTVDAADVADKTVYMANGNFNPLIGDLIYILFNFGHTAETLTLTMNEMEPVPAYTSLEDTTDFPKMIPSAGVLCFMVLGNGLYLTGVTKAYVDNLFGDVEAAVAEINTILGGA